MRVLAVVSLVVITSVAVASAGSTHTKITIWATQAPTASMYGGLSYGGSAPPSGAMITQQVDVDMSSTGEARIGNLASTLDPASIQIRDLTDPASSIVEQRFTPGASSPTAVIARYIGETVVAVTPKGDVTGVLRSVDARTIVIEVPAAKDQRRLQVLSRDYVQDLRLPPGPGTDRGSLAVRFATKKPGAHTLELSYRTVGMSWTADYLAVLDEAGTVDFSALATIKNATGATFESADVTLVDGSKPPARYTIAQPTKLVAGQQVQVPLVPAQRKATAKTVILYEAIPDLSAGFQGYANTDCAQYNANTGTGTADVAVEVEVPSKDPLPAGRVRMFRRKGERVEVVSEEQLRSRSGAARIRLDRSTDVVGDRKAITCTNDEKARTLTEHVEITLENKSKRALDVVAREFAWRWTLFRIDAETHKSARTASQAFEYRVTLPAGGKRTISYTLVYTW
ncbi:MAG: DUF4139 domain-containing protein [Kofleriaceae bacterium]